MSEDKQKQRAGGTAQPGSGKSTVSRGKGREAKDESRPGADERQGGKPFDEVRGGRT